MSIEIEQKIYSDFDKLNIESVCGSQKKSYEELWQAILPYMYSLSGPSIYRELNSLISDAAKFYVRVIFESRLNEIEDDTMKKIAKIYHISMLRESRKIPRNLEELKLRYFIFIKCLVMLKQGAKNTDFSAESMSRVDIRLPIALLESEFVRTDETMKKPTPQKDKKSEQKIPVITNQAKSSPKQQENSTAIENRAEHVNKIPVQSTPAASKPSSNQNIPKHPAISSVEICRSKNKRITKNVPPETGIPKNLVSTFEKIFEQLTNNENGAVVPISQVKALKAIKNMPNNNLDKILKNKGIQEDYLTYDAFIDVFYTLWRASKHKKIKSEANQKNLDIIIIWKEERKSQIYRENANMNQIRNMKIEYDELQKTRDKKAKILDEEKVEFEKINKRYESLINEKKKLEAQFQQKGGT